MWRRCVGIVIVGAWLALGGLGVVGCGKHGTSSPSGGSALSPSKVVLQRNVELAPVQQRALVYRVETVGVLEAEGQTDIAAGVSGVVDQVFFREGDEVQPGTLLATIDQTRFQADDDLAKANMERSKAAMDLARDLADRAVRAGAGTSEEERAKTRGQLRVAEAEYRSAVAAFARARNNFERSRVRAPYAGRINKRYITKGTYLEEKTSIATIADLSRIRLVGYVPETAAPVLRDLLSRQDTRLDGYRAGMTLAGVGPASSPLAVLSNLALVNRDFVLSGYDPEFELLAFPGQTYFGRIFYMSTVANVDTHMFESKAEVLGYHEGALTPSQLDSITHLIQQQVGAVPALFLQTKKEPDPHSEKPNLLSPLAVKPEKNTKRSDTRNAAKLWPGFTAKIRFPLRSNPNASVVPEEAVRASERGFIAFVPVKQTREDGQTEWIARVRILELGFRADGWVEVRHGLAPGEWIIRRGAEALEDGTPVKFASGPK
ncbi:MAG: efflux RND transporter periplasmic adaptor subunit [Gemmataceae bacterium]|nr:efflux RND transporter periplasmic adaptor subunit [Gemmataceae bacterium]